MLDEVKTIIERGELAESIHLPANTLLPILKQFVIYNETLTSISISTCCTDCQEAKLVALSGLRRAINQTQGE